MTTSMSNKIIKSSNKQRGRKVSEEKWEDHRKIILELWLTHGLSREEVVSKLQTAHGFVVTTDQLHNRITKKWSTRKNITKNEWRKLYWDELNRREAGDRRDVLFNDRLITNETKNREWERYSFAAEARTGALSPLPENFKYRAMSNMCSPGVPGHLKDTSASWMTSSYNDILAIGTPMLSGTITSTLSQVVPGPSSLTLLEANISHPFEWRCRLDWNALTKTMDSNNQMVRMCKLDGSRLNAMFYSQHQPLLTATAATGPLALQYLISSVINGVDYQTNEGGGTCRQLTAFPRPAVSALFKALPPDIVAVIRHRLRAAAVKDDEPDRVAHLLELDRDLCAGDFGTDVEVSSVLDRLRTCAQNVAIIIVQYASRASRTQSSVLSQVINIFETCEHTRRRRLDFVSLIKILIEAGATLTQSCFFLDWDNANAFDSLIALEDGGILIWIQNQLLTKSLEHNKKRYFDLHRTKLLPCWIISALKRAFYDKTAQGMWTEQDDKATCFELLHGFQAALDYSWTWAVEIFYDTCCQLGYTVCYSQVDLHLDPVVVQACNERAWGKACQAIRNTKPVDLDRVDYHPTDWREQKRALKEAVQAEDFLKIEELLDTGSLGTDSTPQEVLHEALNADCDSVAALAATYQGGDGIIDLLEGLHAGAISILLLCHSHCTEALQAMDRDSMINHLEDMLYRRLPHEECRQFPCSLELPRMEAHQIVLRVLGYYAIYNDDIDLLDWLCSHDLATGSIRVVKSEHMEVQRLCTTVSQKEKLLKTSFPHDRDRQLPPLLNVAIQYRRTKILSYLLNRRLVYRASDTLLYAVRSRAHFDTIKLLLRADHHGGIAANAQYGSAALRLTIRDKNYELLRVLARASDIHGLESVGDEDECLENLDPFGEAVLQGDCTAVKILLENGGDPNTIVAFDGLQEHALRSVGNSVLWRMTPLLVAVDVGDYAMVQFLMDNGAETNPELTRGVLRSPLQRASEIGDFDMVQLFFANGAVVDSVAAYGGGTALQLAAMSGHVGIAALLIQQGANVNHPPARGPGRTAFEAAAEWFRPDMMHLLVQEGAQLNLEIKDEVEESFGRDGMVNSHLYVFHVWRSVHKSRTQFERALQFAEDRKEYVSKTIVENIGRQLGLFSDDRFLRIAS